MRIWAIFVVVALCRYRIVETKNLVEILYFGNCKESDNDAIYHLENTTFGMVSFDSSEGNTTVVIKEDMDRVMVTLKSYICKTSNDAECESLLAVSVPDACPRMKERGQFYSIFSESMEPPLSCPFKKGIYQVRRAKIEARSVENLMDYTSAYTTKYLFKWKGKHAGCFMSKAKKTRVRSRKKKKN